MTTAKGMAHMAPDIVFKRERICERIGISKEAFYKITQMPGSPIKKVADVWVCNMEELGEWIKGQRKGKNENK